MAFLVEGCVTDMGGISVSGMLVLVGRILRCASGLPCFGRHTLCHPPLRVGPVVATGNHSCKLNYLVEEERFC